MSYKYIIDSSAWIEYYRGSYKGQQIINIIEKEKIATSILAIAELADKFEREDQVFTDLFLFIQSRSAILNMNYNIALQAAKLKKIQRKKNGKFGLIDAIHLATAIQENAIFVTSDTDFNGINEAIII